MPESDILKAGKAADRRLRAIPYSDLGPAGRILRDATPEVHLDHLLHIDPYEAIRNEAERLGISCGPHGGFLCEDWRILQYLSTLDGDAWSLLWKALNS